MRVISASRRARESGAAASKLARIARLERQKVLHELPETRVEQSFNEQLFAWVLGYRTLLSHDGAGRFHLMPHNAVAPRKLDDFSLGFFGEDDGPGRTFATAEFKGPEFENLDKRQTSGRHRGLTPVEQGFEAAVQHGGNACRWVIISNFRELRLYSIDGTCIATADLLQIRSRDDLAQFCAHFDRRALLGDGEKEPPEMTLAFSGLHPARGFDARPDHFRTQWIYTPTWEQTLAFHDVEPRMRNAIQGAPAFDRFFDRLPVHPPEPALIGMKIDGGWLVAESAGARSKIETRVAVNPSGQVVMSTRRPAMPGPPATYHQVWDGLLDDEACLFGSIVIAVEAWHAQQPAHVGALELVLQDVRGFQWRPAPSKTAAEEELSARWLAMPTTLGTGHQSVSATDGMAVGLTRVIAEVAIRFRDATGGVIVDLDKLVKEFVSALPRR
jgi:hypothetical protein